MTCEKIANGNKTPTEETQPTSLLNSFWEPLESGFEPLIFIPPKRTKTKKY